MISPRIIALALVAICHATSFAQAPLRSTHFDSPRAALQPLAQRPAGEGQMILGGLVGGTVGFLVGGYAGALINDSEGGDLSALEGFAWGGVIGETIALPLGVHVANRRQGNYGFALLASSALSAIALAAATVGGEDHLEYLIPVPVLQLVTSMLIETRTTK